MKKVTRFFAGAFYELKRVKWPTFPQVVRYTIAVVVLMTFFALFSYGVQTLMAFVVEKLG